MAVFKTNTLGADRITFLVGILVLLSFFFLLFFSPPLFFFFFFFFFWLRRLLHALPWSRAALGLTGHQNHHASTEHALLFIIVQSWKRYRYQQCTGNQYKEAKSPCGPRTVLIVEIAIGSRRVGTSIPTCAFRGCHRLTTLYLSNPEWVGFYSDQTLS